MRALLLLALLATAAGCFPQFRPAARNPLGGGLSVESEIEIGAEIHRQVRAQAHLVTDPILLDYVNALGQQLVAATEPQPFVYRFSVIEDDELNAFAVPGGYVYLHSAVVAQAGDVAELAGVLAHEIAHVRERHIARSQENQGLRTLAAAAAIALSGGDPAVAAVASGINVAIQLKHTRDHEDEADRSGIGYMVRAGYEPRGMVRFFERIQAAGASRASGIPPYLFTHPDIPERIHASRAEIRRINPPGGLRTSDEELAGMQARLAALLEPVAGGSGLLARASFDRTRTDPLLEQARERRAADDLDGAAEILARAQQVEPGDPRVALARAELAEQRGDLREAAAQLRRAFELDPTVPLVQYRLGLVHRRLGERSRAVFYLEQAASNFRPDSGPRKRAEFEIEQLEFPVFESSGIALRAGEPNQTRFARGKPIVWWGRVAHRFVSREPPVEVTWVDPSGAVAKNERAQHVGTGMATSSFATNEATAGRWSVRVRVGDSPIEQRTFEVEEPAPAGPER